MSFQTQCMSGEAIYENFKNGRGGEGLAEAARLIREASVMYEQHATDIRQLTSKMESYWKGDAAGAAQRGAGPLAVEHELAQPELTTVDDLSNRQVGSYNDAKNSVQPIPDVPKEPGFWDNVWSFGGASDNYEQQVQANRQANDNNVQVMQAYEGASLYNGENMPKTYGQMQPDNSQIVVGGKDDTGTGDPGDNGDGRDSVTRPPGSTGTSGTTGVSPSPTNPSGFNPTNPSGYVPPGGGGNQQPIPTPTPYPPGTYPPGTYPPGSGPYPPGTFPPGGGNQYPPGTRPPGSGPGGRPPGMPTGRGPGGGPGGPGQGGPGMRPGGGPGYGPGGGMRGGAGGFGPGAGMAMGADDGRAGGAGRGGFGPGGLGAGGAAGGAGGRGGGMMGGAGGGGARGGEDEEHTRASFLVEDDPDALFGTDQVTAPPVIGE